jgi:hypothetical protein
MGFAVACRWGERFSRECSVPRVWAGDSGGSVAAWRCNGRKEGWSFTRDTRAAVRASRKRGSNLGLSRRWGRSSVALSE